MNVSPEQRQRIQLSIRNAMSRPFRLEISRTDSTVTLLTPQGSRILYTDNREVTVPIGPDLDSTVKCKWDKNKLVIESETNAGVKIKYTYERDDNQLEVKVRIDVSASQAGDPIRTRVRCLVKKVVDRMVPRRKGRVRSRRCR